MNITVVGTGYVGLVTGACFSDWGHSVLCVDNDESKIAQLKRNDIIGEIAILCDVPRTATVTAAEELTALKITKDLFFRMVIDFPDMGIEIMRSLAHRLEMTTSQLREARAAAAN